MIHLITYGDNKYHKAKQRLYQEALDTGWFDTITLYGPGDLDKDYKKKLARKPNHQNVYKDVAS